MSLPIHNLSNRPAPVLTKATEQFLEDLAKSLQIPDTLYEEAEGRYISVADWLRRPTSSLKTTTTEVYAQGSFELGTVIKPVSDLEDYDIDMVCVIDVNRTVTTQEDLKNALMLELEGYAAKYSMQKPEPQRRCVRLHYAKDAQFHLDATPATPDGARQRFLLEASGLNNEWVELAVGITDEEHLLYKLPTEDWPHSNPRGYAHWFRSRMKEAFERRREAIRLSEGRAKATDIPKYRVRTPLQSAIQILKRHRDMTHQRAPEDKPISIIITTLAALSYNQETTIHETLYKILFGAQSFIEDRGGVAWIPNPTDGRENFADKWQEHPERAVAFYEWLEKARTDFVSVANIDDRRRIGEALAPVMGHKLIEKALNQKTGSSSLLGKTWNLLSPPHKEPMPWNLVKQGQVRIKSAKIHRNGFRPEEFSSGGPALPKNCELFFEAETNIPKPFKVYWQIVNTGSEADDAGGLRGRFEEGQIEEGKLKKKESTLYAGSHTIECFIVRDGICVASSEPYIVNIR